MKSSAPTWSTGPASGAGSGSAEQRGARYVKAHVPLPLTSPDEVVEAIFAAVTPRTRAIFLSHVTSGTALRLPIEAVARRAREAGILTVVDGAHAVGQWPVDLDAIGVDLYASNFHKWLCAPKGSGFLYARPEQQRWLESPIVSWGWVEGNDHHRPQSQFVSRNQIQGTRDIAAFLTAPRRWRTRKPGTGRPCASGVTPSRWRRGTGSPRSPACRRSRRSRVAGGYRWFRQMAIAPLPDGIDGKALKRRLYDEYRVETPVTWWDEQAVHSGFVPGLQHAGRSGGADFALENLLPEMTPGYGSVVA